jgi:predicted metal-binding protein
MNQTHTVFVCTTCDSTWKNGQRVGTSGGEQLLAQLTTLHEKGELRDRLSLQPVACMSGCTHACTVAFSAPGKYTYLFGDLPATEESTPTAVLACAAQYVAKPDGQLPWSERPEPLKKGVLAKIPPLSSVEVASPTAESL